MKSTGLRILTAGMILLIAGCFNVSKGPWPGETWERSTPEAQGIDSKRLLALLKIVKPDKLDIHSMVIIRNGKLVADFYREPYEKDMLHLTYSSTKSFTSTLIGIAIDQHLIGSINDSVFTYLPEYKGSDPLMAEMTIEDLLTMRSGVCWTEEYNAITQSSTYRMMYRNDDWLEYFFSQPMDSAPGELFVYNDGNSHVLSEILSRVTGGNVRKFAEENLLTPLGITDYVWSEAPGGCIIGGTGLSLRTEDLARLGYLFLNNGYWNGRKIVSSGWVKKVLKNHVDFSGMPMNAVSYGYEGYGYQWWIFMDGIYATMGYGGQCCFVNPEKNLVIAMNASTNQQQLDSSIVTLVGLGLQRAAEYYKALPENPEASEALYQYMDSLTESSRPGPFEDKGIIDKLAGHTISFPEQPLGLKSLRFSDGGNEELICEAIMDLDELVPKGEDSVYKITFAIGLDGDFRKTEVDFWGYNYTLANVKNLICARAVKISSDTFSYNFNIPAIADFNNTDTITLKDGEISLSRLNPVSSRYQFAKARGVME